MRILLSAVTVAAVLGSAAAGAQPASTSSRPDSPRLADIARVEAFRDSTLPRSSKTLAAIPPTWPTFEITTSTGEPVSIHLSKSYPNDPTIAQQWGDFLGSLIHGSELSSLSAYFLKSGEVQTVCGRQALACYGQDQLFAPIEDPSFELSAEAVITHEYGHHVAAHRRNDPWVALDTGPKRWASYEQVCTKSRHGQLFPGAEDERHYTLNPGEGWAETYRVLNEHHAGLPEASWNIVSQSLYPDSNAMTAAEKDVTSPWTKPTAVIHQGSVRKARSFLVSTPLDGRVTVSLRASSRDQLDVFAPSSARLRHVIGKTTSVSTTACGQRALRVRVSGSGSFRLAISKP